MTFPSPSGRSGGVSSTTDGTSHTITLPASNVGDLLLIFFTSDENPTVTASAGWYKYGTAANAALVNGSVFYKWAEGSDTCTITTSTAQQSSHVSYCIPNGGVPSGSSASASSTNSDPPSTSVTLTEDYLVIVSRHGDAQVVATAAGASYTNLQTRTGGSATGASTNTAERQLNISTGSTDPAAFTSATEDWVCWTIVIPLVITTTKYVLDDFSAGSLNTAIWDSSESGGGTAVAVTGGQLVLTTPSGASGYAKVKRVPGVTLNEGQIYGIRTTNYGSAVKVSVETHSLRLYMRSAPTKEAGYIWNQGGINDLLNSTGSSVSYMIAWNPPPAEAVYLGMGREAGTGNLMWVYSPDGLHWRRSYSTTWPSGWDINDVGINVDHGQYNAETGSDSATFDDFCLFVVPTQIVKPKVRRAGVLATPTAVSVRRASGWVTPTAVKVRRGGVWVNPV